MYEAVLLDRDGVINRERSDYVKSWQEFEYLPGALPALARLAGLNCPVFLITNQSAIGRGIVAAATVDAIHGRVRRDVLAGGGRIDGVYICPHHPDDGCSCRKPQPGLLLQAAADYSLNLRHCVFVGDSLTDRQAALAAGCGSILVATGRQGPQLLQMARRQPGFVVVDDLAAAVSLILANDPFVGQELFT